jgi:hypothetical protein
MPSWRGLQQHRGWVDTALDREAPGRRHAVGVAAPAVGDGTWLLSQSLVSWSVAARPALVEEVGKQLEPVVVAGAELVHRGVHPCLEAEQLGVAVAQWADDDGAAVGGVVLTGDPAAAFEPVQDAGDGGGVRPERRARALRLTGPWRLMSSRQSRSVRLRSTWALMWWLSRDSWLLSSRRAALRW